MKAFLESMKIRRVKVRALKSNFYANGHVAQAGEEAVMDYVDASYLIASGKAELVGDAPARIIGTKDLADPPPLRRPA